MSISFSINKKVSIQKQVPSEFLAEEEETERFEDLLGRLKMEVDRAATEAEKDNFVKALSCLGSTVSIFNIMETISSLTKEEVQEITKQKGQIAEMKAQLLNEIGEYFKAIKQANICINLLPNWPIGYQTLGRAQLNYGEPTLALESFNKVREIAPKFNIQDDIDWVQDVLSSIEKK